MKEYRGPSRHEGQVRFVVKNGHRLVEIRNVDGKLLSIIPMEAVHKLNEDEWAYDDTLRNIRQKVSK